MTGETVVYKNELNLVPLRKFTSTEINLFFAMCNKLKEQDDNVLIIPFEDLKELSNYSSKTRNVNRFVEELEHVYSKMLNLTYTQRTATKITKFVLFYKYEIDIEERTLQIATAPDLKHVLNNITGDFTKFDLQEMTHLKSSYAKNMFRFLKQYKHTGYLKMDIDDFREKLDIPKSYRMNNIDTYVLKPVIKELGSIFKNLNINKIKAKKGRKIEWIEFTFEPEKRIHSKRQPEMVECTKPKQNERREMTPEWLKNKNYEEGKSERPQYTDEEREAFLNSLEKRKEMKDE